MKLRYSILLFFCLVRVAFSQNCLVLNQNIYAKLNNNCYLVVNEPSQSGIITLGSGGNIVSENENNVVKWNIGTSIGNYVVPFTTITTVKIPLSVNIVTAGVGATSAIIFSTYETATDLNTAYPSDVTNMNSSCSTGNALYAVDRFWRIDANSYTTKPTPVINFRYNDAVNEIGGTNTIVEGKLKAQRFNAGSNLWETPLKLYGIANPILNFVAGVSVTPTDFHKSWTLIDTVIMTIPVFSSASNNTICTGNVSTITPAGATNYTLLPGSLTSSTNFTVNPTSTTIYTITGAIGSGTAICVSVGSSVAISTIVVNTTPTLVVNSGVICSGGSFTINPSGALTYTTSGGTSIVSPTTTTSYTVAGTSVQGCTNNAVSTVSVQTSLTVSIAGTNTICSGESANLVANGAATYSWSSGATTNTIAPTPTTNTTYSVLGASGTCSNVASVLVIVNNTPTIAVSAISNNTICTGNSSIITPTGASSYTLLPPNITGTSFTVSPTTTTTYTISGTNTLGCASSVTSNPTTTITVNALPVIGLATNSDTVCSGSSAIISPTGAVTYTLLPPSTTGTSFTVTPIVTTIYTIIGANSFGCLSSSTLAPTTTITVNPTPTVALSVANYTVCSGNSAVINPNGALSYTLLPDNITGTNFTVNPSTSATYTVVGQSSLACVSDPANSGTVQIVVGVINLQPANVASITCNGSNNGLIGLDILGGVSGYTFTWSNSATTPTITNLSVGVYSVTVVDASNCIVTQTFNISEPSAIVLSSIQNTASCPQNPNGAVALVVAGGNPNYQTSWSNGAVGLVNTNLPAGLYTATVTDQTNCSRQFTVAIDTLSFSNAQCVDLFIPEFFSPSGDGKNDFFVISKIDFFPNNTLSIFNRWGSLVYQKKAYKNEWSGKANVTDAMGSGLLPSGTYYVVLDFGDNESKPYNGYVELQY